MHLHRRTRANRLMLAMTLQPDDRVDEQRISPRLAVALRLMGGDHVGGGLLHHRIAQIFQRPQDRGLTGAGSTGHDETPHGQLFLLNSASRQAPDRTPSRMMVATYAATPAAFLG